MEHKYIVNPDMDKVLSEPNDKDFFYQGRLLTNIYKNSEIHMVLEGPYTEPTEYKYKSDGLYGNKTNKTDGVNFYYKTLSYRNNKLYSPVYNGFVYHGSQDKEDVKFIDYLKGFNDFDLKFNEIISDNKIKDMVLDNLKNLQDNYDMNIFSELILDVKNEISKEYDINNIINDVIKPKLRSSYSDFLGTEVDKFNDHNVTNEVLDKIDFSPVKRDVIVKRDKLKAKLEESPFISIKDTEINLNANEDDINDCVDYAILITVKSILDNQKENPSERLFSYFDFKSYINKKINSYKEKLKNIENIELIFKFLGLDGENTIKEELENKEIDEIKTIIKHNFSDNLEYQKMFPKLNDDENIIHILATAAYENQRKNDYNYLYKKYSDDIINNYKINNEDLLKYVKDKLLVQCKKLIEKNKSKEEITNALKNCIKEDIEKIRPYVEEYKYFSNVIKEDNYKELYKERPDILSKEAIKEIKEIEYVIVVLCSSPHFEKYSYIFAELDEKSNIIYFNDKKVNEDRVYDFYSKIIYQYALCSKCKEENDYSLFNKYLPNYIEYKKEEALNISMLNAELSISNRIESLEKYVDKYIELLTYTKLKNKLPVVLEELKEIISIYKEK